MSISMYQASVPIFEQMLGSLSSILNKAAAYAETKKIEPDALINFRLYPDMLPFFVQIYIAADTAVGCSARLAGQEPPEFKPEKPTFENLINLVEDGLAFLKTLKPEQIDGSEDKTISYTRHGRTNTFIGLPYLTKHAIPNFFFHVTTAYDILRHNGLEIGKADYIGNV